MKLLLPLIVLALGLPYMGAANKKFDERPIDVTTSNSRAQVFAPDYLQQLGSHDATLRAIDGRLTGIDDRLKLMQGRLDNDVMPIVSVMKFLEWVIGAIFVTLVGVWVNKKFGGSKPGKPHPAPA